DGVSEMSNPADLSRAHLRVARPSEDFDAVCRFYRDGLGFVVLGCFEGHDGFDGVMLGHPGAAYHLEFTRKTGHQAGKAPTQDNLLSCHRERRGRPCLFSVAVAADAGSGRST